MINSFMVLIISSILSLQLCIIPLTFILCNTSLLYTLWDAAPDEMLLGANLRIEGEPICIHELLLKFVEDEKT